LQHLTVVKISEAYNINGEDVPVQLVLMKNLTIYQEENNHLSIVRFPGSFVKRAADIVFSLLVIVLLLSWLLPLLAVLIKLSSKGPVFFVQQRTGRYNIPFNCYKLRSMIVNETSDLQQAFHGDPRVTLVGKLLRKLSLDELPQFFNVLAGEMSLVGPRPHMLHHTNIYTQDVAEYPKRLLVRPGITGLSQVEGYRGEIRNHRMIRNRVVLDIFYIKRWSMWLDLVIILKTIKLVLFGDEKAV
jgi:putative colanic acid biosynthesis UDP-glucose lipid carrier transferase